MVITDIAGLPVLRLIVWIKANRPYTSQPDLLKKFVREIPENPVLIKEEIVELPTSQKIIYIGTVVALQRPSVFSLTNKQRPSIHAKRKATENMTNGIKPVVTDVRYPERA
jgi:hypothetical protein